MRLRRIATNDHHIVDQNNGERHEAALTGLVRDYGLLHEAELIPRSYGGNSWFAKFTPAAGKELLASLPVIAMGLLRGKLNPKIAIFGHKIPKDDLKSVQAIFDKVEGREERFELNLYIAGEDEDQVAADGHMSAESQAAASAPGPEGATSAAPQGHGQGADASAPAGESPSESTPHADAAGSDKPAAAGGEANEPRPDDPTGEGPGEGDDSNDGTEGSAQ
jgi:succinate dehydrogenase / fumarate reductase iron-sulfur subunit